MPNQKLLPCRGSSHVQKHVEKHDLEENDLQFCEDQDAPELFNATSGFLANDEVPETLAAADFIDRWLAERQPDSGAVAVGRLAEALGTADFIVRGETITALAKPHRFYLLQPVQEAFTITSGEKETEVRALLEACGMERFLTAVLSRRMARSDNLEVWE